MATKAIPPRSVPQTCWMCGRSIRLEECKIDELGLAVHENCYVAKVRPKSGKPAAPTTQ